MAIRPTPQPGSSTAESGVMSPSEMKRCVHLAPISLKYRSPGMTSWPTSQTFSGESSSFDIDNFHFLDSQFVQQARQHFIRVKIRLSQRAGAPAVMREIAGNRLNFLDRII